MDDIFGVSKQDEEFLRDRMGKAGPPVEAEAEAEPEQDGLAPVAGPEEQPETEGEPQQEGVTEPDGEDEDFAEFAKKHANKDPQEILRLAYNQNKARAEARGQARQATEIVRRLEEQIAARLKATQERQEREKKEIEEKLVADPDAAVLEMVKRQHEAERTAVEQRAHEEMIAAQTQLARQMIPDFDQEAVELAKFGIERIGYTPEEAFSVQDARDLTTLDMAMRFQRLIDAGVVDRRGRLLNGQAPTQMSAPASQRLAVTPPKTLGGMGRTANGGTMSLAERAQRILELSDAEFNKIPDDQIGLILRELGEVRQ